MANENEITGVNIYGLAQLREMYSKFTPSETVNQILAKLDSMILSILTDLNKGN